MKNRIFCPAWIHLARSQPAGTWKQPEWQISPPHPHHRLCERCGAGGRPVTRAAHTDRTFNGRSDSPKWL